jgi:hypothetical protein
MTPIDKQRLTELGNEDMRHLALNDPQGLYECNPYAVWYHNKDWMIRWRSHWVCRHQPKAMLEANPGWMCAMYPEVVVVLDLDIILRYYPVWVLENRPDIMAVVPHIPGENRPMPAYSKKRAATMVGTSDTNKPQTSSLWSRFKSLFAWMTRPKFDPRLPDRMRRMVNSSDDLYPEGVTRR